jgi:AMP deaminase
MTSSGDPIDYLRRRSNVPRSAPPAAAESASASAAPAAYGEEEEDGSHHRHGRRHHLRRNDSDDDAAPPSLPRAERLSYRPQSQNHAAAANNHQQQPEEEPPARARPETGTPWPYRENLSFTRNLIFYGAGSITVEHETACRRVQEARKMRQHYQGGKAIHVVSGDLLTSDALTWTMRPHGVAEIYATTTMVDDGPTNGSKNLVVVPTIDDFVTDYKRLEAISKEGAMRSFCFQRLQMLGTSFSTFVLLLFSPFCLSVCLFVILLLPVSSLFFLSLVVVVVDCVHKKRSLFNPPLFLIRSISHLFLIMKTMNHPFRVAATHSRSPRTHRTHTQ